VANFEPIFAVLLFLSRYNINGGGGTFISLAAVPTQPIFSGAGRKAKKHPFAPLSKKIYLRAPPAAGVFFYRQTILRGFPKTGGAWFFTKTYSGGCIGLVPPHLSQLAIAVEALVHRTRLVVPGAGFTACAGQQVLSFLSTFGAPPNLRLFKCVGDVLPWRFFPRKQLVGCSGCLMFLQGTGPPKNSSIEKTNRKSSSRPPCAGVVIGDLQGKEKIWPLGPKKKEDWAKPANKKNEPPPRRGIKKNGGKKGGGTPLKWGYPCIHRGVGGLISGDKCLKAVERTTKKVPDPPNI